MADHQGNRHIRFIRGKWRIMDKSGQHLLHAGNDPTADAADGGGYSTYEEALRQFQAMESHMHGH